MKRLFTSESVTEGHPDKVADYIADSILDEALKQDPNARVACEVSVTTNFCLIYGEITTKATLDFISIAKTAIRELGFNQDELGFSADTINFEVRIDNQSPDIALGINKEIQGAGDQGIMFGYAADETAAYLPLACFLANKLAERLAYVRKQNIIEGLRPDGKTQVTVLYDEKGNAIGIDTVILSTQHDDNKDLDILKNELHEHVFSQVLPPNLISKETKFLINPTGRFVIGGPHGDAGLTGRKIIVDTYGGYARNGGGAFSGKDPSKVDRSAAYMARYIAKNIVASGLAKKCEIQLAYAIGVAAPVSVYIDTFQTGVVADELILDATLAHFDLRPGAIIESLDLKKPIYRQTTNYGHFGKPDLPWEKIDKIAIYKNILK